VNNTELWNNLGLCCFYASQYDMALHCFERALGLADDDNMADVWYNIGQIAIGIGDLGLAYQVRPCSVPMSQRAYRTRAAGSATADVLKCGSRGVEVAAFRKRVNILRFHSLTIP
jgi:tetratricopeptide repeat protein 8